MCMQYYSYFWMVHIRTKCPSESKKLFLKSYIIKLYGNEAKKSNKLDQIRNFCQKAIELCIENKSWEEDKTKPKDNTR